MRTVKKNYDLYAVTTTAETRAGTVQIESFALECRKGGITEYFSLNDELIDILTGDEWQISIYDNGDGRLRCDCWRNHRKDRVGKFFLYDLAYACYTGRARTDTLLDDMKSFQDWKDTLAISVDHADNNKHNNTVLNLSLMLGSLNGVKSEVVARFVSPFCLNSAYCNGEYRVQLLYNTTPEDEGHANVLESVNAQLAAIGCKGYVTSNEPIHTPLRFICKDAESYVACLRRLYDTRVSWCDPEHTPRENRAANESAVYWASEFKRSTFAQTMLSLADRSDFQPFPVEKVSA